MTENQKLAKREYKLFTKYQSARAGARVRGHRLSVTVQDVIAGKMIGVCRKCDRSLTVEWRGDAYGDALTEDCG